MTEVKKIHSEISSKMSKIKQGTLRFWGAWFGRPHDNIHTIIKCDCDEDNESNLYIYFDQDEKLTISNPKGFKINKSVFYIKIADCVIWEWFSYGKPKTKDNLYFEKYTRVKNKIEVEHNIDWYKPEYKVGIRENAVEIL